MALFYFTVTPEKIESYNGEVAQIPDGFHQYIDKNFGESDIYYKVRNGKVFAIICDTTINQDYAHQEVKDFLEGLELS